MVVYVAIGRLDVERLAERLHIFFTIEQGDRQPFPVIAHPVSKSLRPLGCADNHWLT